MVYFNQNSAKYKQYLCSSYSAPSGTAIWNQDKYRDSNWHRCSSPEGQPKCRIRINVSGMIFETWLADLNRHPTTLLGNPLLRQPFFDNSRNEYFFDRHRGAFEGIFHYLKYGGRIKCPSNVPDDVFYEEMLFFKLEVPVVHRYRNDQGYIPEKIKLPRGRMRQRIWMLFEYPETSGYAYGFGIISVLFVMISITVFCLETIPHQNNRFTSTCINSKYNFINVFFISETICNIWFTMELIGRIISCPDKKGYIKDCQNVIDMAALVPYYITLMDILYSSECIEGKKGGKSLAFLRVIRLIRIFKLTKHSAGLQVLILTFQASMHGLGIFFMAMSVSMLVFSSIIYHIEVDVEHSQIESIPGAFWWCVITMCTVGYGDVVPKSVPGKIVGGICAVSGVLTLAMAVPIITENFNKFYSHKTGRGRL